MKLLQAIKGNKTSEVRKITKNNTVADIADALEKMSPRYVVSYFKFLTPKSRAAIFSSLEDDYKQKLAAIFTDAEIKKYVNELFVDEIVDLIEEAPEELSKRILKSVSSTTKKDVQKILRYEDDVVGSIMTIDILPIKQSLNVSEAIKYIKDNKTGAEFSHYFFVVNSKGQLKGYIKTEDLLFSKPDATIKSIFKPAISVKTTTNKEAASLTFANYNMSVLPVVNSKTILVGAISADEVIDVVQEAATEDIHRMAGIEVDADESYSQMSVIKIFKSRVFWLMLLMISATLSQIVLDAFQGISTAAIATTALTSAIVAILPVISGAAGNAGSQSSTTVIRALAIGDITTKQYMKVLWKEFRVSLIIGLVLGIANFGRLLIYYGAKGELSTPLAFDFYMLSFAASLSILIVIVLAKIVGGMLPLIAKSFKLDPAVMAAPLLTTLIDALSTLIFFGISIGIMVLVL